MTVPFILAALAMQGGDGAARAQFQNCLSAFTDQQLQAQASVEYFEQAIATACQQQAQLYAAEYFQSEVRQGYGRVAAEQNASLVVEELRMEFVENFRRSRGE